MHHYWCAIPRFVSRLTHPKFLNLVSSENAGALGAPGELLHEFPPPGLLQQLVLQVVPLLLYPGLETQQFEETSFGDGRMVKPNRYTLKPSYNLATYVKHMSNICLYVYVKTYIDNTCVKNR